MIKLEYNEGLREIIISKMDTPESGRILVSAKVMQYLNQEQITELKDVLANLELKANE